MKHTKKLVSLLLTLVMVLSMSITAFAANNSNTNTKGKITINNAVKDETYSIYKIMDLESYSAAKDDPENLDTGAYSYKVNSAWSDFFATDAKGAGYVDIDENGYVSWKTGKDAAEFAKEALKYAKEKTSTPVGATESKKAESTTVTFENLELGYYLLDTSLGSLCSLDTTNPEVTMKEKNAAPTVDKKVKEDSKTGEDAWGDSNTAQIGDTVEFKTTIHAKKVLRTMCFMTRWKKD